MATVLCHVEVMDFLQTLQNYKNNDNYFDIISYQLGI